MKVICAQFRHETNTFSPLETTWNSFGTSGPLHGSEAIEEMRSSGQPIEAFIDAVESWGAELVIPIAGRATPSGLVSQDAFDRAIECIVGAVAQGCDAVLLDLHGAMVTECLSDADGEFVKRVRAAAGPVPIGVALDFHANISSTIVDSATVIVGYKSYPHVDMYETGARVADLIHRVIFAGLKPSLAWMPVPLLSNTLCQNTGHSPMRQLIEGAVKAEHSGRAECVSVFPGFYSSDVPHAGFSVVVVSDNGEGKAVAREIAEDAWGLRTSFVYEAEPLQDSIRRARSAERFPVVLVDHCDNPSAGSTQDCMTVVEEVLRQGLSDVIVGSVRDPEAVDTLFDVKIGTELSIDLGGKTDMPALDLKGQPLRLTGVVRAISDGAYTIDGPVFNGMRVRMGRTVCFEVPGMLIVLTERNTEPFDLNVFRCVGIEPSEHRYIILKSKMHFRAVYEAVAADIIECSGTGVGTSDFSLLKYKNVRRPIFPLDPQCSFSSSSANGGRRREI